MIPEESRLSRFPPARRSKEDLMLYQPAIYLFPVLFLLTVAYENIYLKLNTAIYEIKYTRLQTMLFACIKLAAFVVCGVLRLPQIFLYLFFFLSFRVSLLVLRQRQESGYFFWSGLGLLYFMSLHLTTLSVVSLWTGQTLRDTYQDPFLWMGMICVSMALLCLLSMLMGHKTKLESIRILTGDSYRLKRLVWFQIYAVGYLLFDSIPCMYALPYSMLAVFLIGSIVLLLLQYHLVLVYTFKIIEKAHYEAEYYRLEQERANHVKKELELRHLAYQDGLTGAYTRRYALEMLESLLLDKRSITLAYIDLNGLKKVNDTLGHLVGDLFILTVAKTLNLRLRQEDVLARIGGDEFLIIFPGKGEKDLRIILEQVNQELQEKPIKGHIPSFSFGVTEMAEDETATAEELLRRGDRLMYIHKRKNKERGGAAWGP